MELSNKDLVSRSLELLREGLRPFILREMEAIYKGRYIAEALTAVRSDRDKPSAGTDPNRWDIQAMLSIMVGRWQIVFNRKLGEASRTLVYELKEVRNNWAHQQTFTNEDAYRALDSISRLLKALSAEQIAEVEKYKREVRVRLDFEEQDDNKPYKHEMKAVKPHTANTNVEVAYWITPVGNTKNETADRAVQKRVGDAHVYAFGDTSPGHKALKPGDMLCFYAAGKGVIAHAEVASTPTENYDPKMQQLVKYPWVFGVDNVKLYLDKPVIINSTLRGQLNAFKGKNPTGSWGWFVLNTHPLSEHDFGLLTRS